MNHENHVMINGKCVCRIILLSLGRTPLAEIIKMNADVLTVPELLKRSSNLKGCIVLGINHDDTQFFGIAELNAKDVVYMIEQCKYFILKMDSDQ